MAGLREGQGNRRRRFGTVLGRKHVEPLDEPIEDPVPLVAGEVLQRAAHTARKFFAQLPFVTIESRPHSLPPSGDRERDWTEIIVVERKRLQTTTYLRPMLRDPFETANQQMCRFRRTADGRFIEAQ